jgi:hypothetical protein
MEKKFAGKIIIIKIVKLNLDKKLIRVYSDLIFR